MRSIAYLICPWALLVTACGTSTAPNPTMPSSESQVQTPDTSAQPAKPAASLPAGEFELPPGDLPTPEQMQKKKEDRPAGDFKLPAELTPDPSKQSSRSSTEIDLQYASWNEVQQLVRGPSGRVTVLDIWSLACGPCMKEYPNLVALQKQYPDQVRAIGANVDFDGRKSRPVETYESRVRDFLTSQNASFSNYLIRTPSDEVFDSLQISSIPTVLVFNASGQLVKQYVDAGPTVGFTYERDIIPLVQSLLSS